MNNWTRTVNGHTYYAERGKYGRTERSTWALRGVIVTMPRTWTDTRPTEKYLVNLWDGNGPYYFANLTAAVDFHAANAGRHAWAV
jgi:hypothetical protein